MKKMVLTFIYLSLVCLCSCQNDLIEYRHEDIKLSIEKGEAWLHDFPLFLGIKFKNPPQIAIWVESIQGEYLSTIYVSHKIATQSWEGNDNNRRKEALPHWCYSRGIQHNDGLYLPTKDKPLIDGISGATPKGSFDVKIHPINNVTRFVVKIEVNHSTDFNEFYNKSAKANDENYSGGKQGSGQPALVYAVDIDLSRDLTFYEAELIGHSSPDGSSGSISEDLSNITTARNIVKNIIIKIL